MPHKNVIHVVGGGGTHGIVHANNRARKVYINLVNDDYTGTL